MHGIDWEIRESSRIKKKTTLFRTEREREKGKVVENGIDGKNICKWFFLIYFYFMKSVAIIFDTYWIIPHFYAII